ncbi:copper resistance CopC family protein [Streptomyces sp. AC495_CC817]|uniref:copper resistance CopC family protein n=1 Tax=Streptomyces sp. AC495_CC817 TaxID=2823900 RepID=UPI001C25EF77|nr:copper resistance CopC family protein [Streptomyces sp. AC495_CC817]
MSPVRRIAAGALVAAVVILATAAPASAHDELIQSDPGVDDRLAAPPESVSLTFSADLLTLGDTTTGAVIVIADSEGRDWSEGAAVVNGRTATAAVKPGMPEAGYQVRWQVVSSDGHPISGIVPFTIGDAEPLQLQSRPDGEAATTPETAGQTASEADGALRLLLVGAGGAAVAAAVLLLIRFLRRPRTAPAAPETGDPADDTL